jgi:hypothetical protein
MNIAQVEIKTGKKKAYDINEKISPNMHSSMVEHGYAKSGVVGSNPTATLQNLKVQGLWSKGVSFKYFKAVWRMIVRSELEAERQRECPEISYVFFLFHPELFGLPTWGNKYFKE